MIGRLATYTLLAALLWNTFGGSLQAAKDLKTMAEYKEACAQKKPLVLFFYAPWCGACKGMKEPYDKVAKDSPDVHMVKINIENKEFKGLMKAFCITSIPTIITRQTGMMKLDQLEKMVAGHKRTPLQPAKEKKQAARAS